MLLAVAAVVAVGVLTAPVEAAPPSALGYWWRLQSGVGPHLTPPGVPEGGLWVTDDPSGDQAVSALRFVPPSGETPVELRLTIAESTGEPTVVACPAASAWEPVDGGAWDDRPDAACDVAVATGTIADGVLTVPLSTFGDGPVDIVLLPDVAASGYFSISFAPPDDRAFTTSSSPAPATSAAPRPASSPVPTVAPRPAAVTYEPPPSGFATPAFEPPPEPDDAFASVPVVSAPSSTDVPAPPARGTREPLAVVALVIVAAGWAYRGRAALRSAVDHPLSAGNAAFSRHPARAAARAVVEEQL